MLQISLSHMILAAIQVTLARPGLSINESSSNVRRLEILDTMKCNSTVQRSPSCAWSDVNPAERMVRKSFSPLCPGI